VDEEKSRRRRGDGRGIYIFKRDGDSQLNKKG
jgi:hypothetical protein